MLASEPNTFRLNCIVAPISMTAVEIEDGVEETLEDPGIAVALVEVCRR